MYTNYQYIKIFFLDNQLCYHVHKESQTIFHTSNYIIKQFATKQVIKTYTSIKFI